MSRKPKSSHKSGSSHSKPRAELDPETRRGITAVVLFAVSALLFLSFFHIAGALGEFIAKYVALTFGWDKFLVPVLLILVGATGMFPDRGRLSTWNHLGILFFFLSFNALLNLLLVNRPEPFTTDISVAGGMVGQFLGTILPNVMGFWGAVVVVSALLFVAVMLVFNTSLRDLIGFHTHLTGRFGEMIHRGQMRKTIEPRTIEIKTPVNFVEEPDPIEEEEDEEAMIEIDEEPEAAPIFTAKPLVEAERAKPEKALTIKRIRKVAIPLDLLEYRVNNANSGDLERNIEIISRTFEQFGIPVEMSDTATGPTVTQYTLRPAQGIKLSRIIGLQNDLALALAAHPIRIEAPIPGKSLVGIEVPNQTIATVSLRDLMESKPFKSRSNNTAIPLGKDVSGATWTASLEKMPHLLVAGSTGSGKSVCLNTIIVSLLYENGPDELKLIMVDPKRVEMKMYEGIPHLLIPPITKAEDAINALKWTVREMERRLDVLAKFGARDITSYNERAEEKMPKIVVIIDELADLMASSGREVEGTIVRVAQMARAVGIHLIIATQRPSVDVITGVIKANFPARIAFAVASQTDSRTILDCAGAEKLLGRGDMLYTSAELSKPKRLQGAYLSDDEIDRVVAFLKKEGIPDYNYAITETARTGTVLDDGDQDEPLLDEAIQALIQQGRASTSLLQRRLKIGYGRAARIMDLLEERGVIGPGEGAKPREVLVTSWPPAGDLAAESIPTFDTDMTEAGLPEHPSFAETPETDQTDEDSATF
ncbi:MAG: DNA translocase FtsK 4TM domain-containing protein [Candidatus Uhrbacteria bacterium]